MAACSTRRALALFVACVLPSASALAQTPTPLPAGPGSWRWLQPKPTAATLRDVAFSSLGSGVAVGEGGTILRTTDRGVTWTQVPSPTGETLTSVVVNGNLVVAAGISAVVRSTDGGASFSQVSFAANCKLSDLALWSATEGYAVCLGGNGFRTTDGFQSLQPAGNVTFGETRSVWFTQLGGRTMGWAVGNTGGTTGFVARTSDGGSSWQAVFRTPSAGGFTAVGGIVVGNEVGVVVGGAGQPNLYFSNDEQGQTFSAMPLTNGEITSLSLRMHSNSADIDLWMAESDGLWATRSSDQVLENPSQLTRPRLYAVASTEPGKAVAVGEGGTILRATFGQQATVSTGGRTERFTGASFPTPDGQIGAFVDNQPGKQRLWGTTNGGQSLTPEQVAPDQIAEVQFVDAQNGFGLLKNGEFYATSSGPGGMRRISRFTQAVSQISFSDTRNGCAGGEALLCTTDGGLTWTSAIPASQLNGGQITDLVVGKVSSAAVTSTGQVWLRASAASGAPWQPFLTLPNANLQAVALTQNGTLVAGGSVLSSTGNGVFLTATIGGSARVQTLTPGHIVSLSTVADRIFVLQKGGRLSEMSAAGAELSAFESHAALNALVPRSLNGLAAPIAVGDFGAVLVFDDQGVLPPPPQNKPPTVTVSPTSLQLSVTTPGGPLAAKGFDPEGQPLTYRWSDLTGSGIAFSTPGSPQTGVAWVRPVPAGATAVARVTVCDPLGACATADVSIVASGGTTPNRPPVASAMGAAANTGDMALLDGSASSDPDGDPLTFQWKQVSGPPAQIQGPSNQPVLLVDAPMVVGSAIFQLRVCDPASLCSTVEVVLVVSAPGVNSAPIPVVPADMVVPAGATITLDAGASLDPEGDAITQYVWREQNNKVPVTPSNRTGSAVTAVARMPGDTYRFIVKVCDEHGACAEAGVTVQVIGGPQNLPPQVKAQVPEIKVNPGETVTLGASAIDPEGAPVKLTWVDLQPGQGLNLQQSGNGTATFVAPAGPAQLRFEVQACDPQGACASAFVNVFVSGSAATANAGPDQDVFAGDTVTLDGSASTGRGNVRWSQTAGTPVTLADPSQLRTTFVAPSTPGTLEFMLEIIGADGRSSTDRVTVTVKPPRGPVADAGRDLTVGFGARVQLDGRRSRDGQGRPLTYRWEGPAGVQLSGADQPLALFIAPAQEGPLQFVLTVCAAPDLCDSAQVTIIVQNGANLPPLPSAGPDRTALAGDQVALDGTSSRDPEGDTLTALWTQRDGAPAHIAVPGSLWTSVELPQVDATTALTFDLQVCDSKGACGVDSVQITVLPRNAGTPTPRLSIVDHENGKVPEDEDFEVRVEATCPASSCRLPELLVLSGPPLARLPGDGVRYHAPRVTRSLPFLLQATLCDEQSHCAAASLDGLVEDTLNEPPVAVTREPQSVRKRQRVVLDGSGSYDPNGEELLYRWTLASGPAGVEVELVGADGPRAHFEAPMIPGADPTGLYRFRLEVCDPRGACDRAAAEVTVQPGEPANRAPVADAGRNKSAPIGIPVPLDASGSYDPDGDGISFRWILHDDPPARLTNDSEAHATLVIEELTTEPVHVQLEVCDAFGGCSSALTYVTPYAVPTDDAKGQAALGDPVQACGCAGAGPEVLGLLPLLGALLVRARRRS